MRIYASELLSHRAITRVPIEKTLFRTASLAANSSSTKEPECVNAAIQQDLWKGKRILLSASLELGTMRRETLKLAVRRADGITVCADDDKDEEDLVSDSDVLVTRYRAGRAYLKAVRQRHIVLVVLRSEDRRHRPPSGTAFALSHTEGTDPGVQLACMAFSLLTIHVSDH